MLFFKTELERRIDELSAKLETVEPGSDEYKSIVKDICMLVNSNEKRKPINWNTILPTILGIVGTIGAAAFLVILEESHILTGKGWSLITRLLPR